MHRKIYWILFFLLYSTKLFATLTTDVSISQAPVIQDMQVGGLQRLVYTLQNHTPVRIGILEIVITKNDNLPDNITGRETGSNTCGNDIAPYGNCQVVIIINPTQVGTINRSLVIGINTRQRYLITQIGLNVTAASLTGCTGSAAPNCRVFLSSSYNGAFSSPPLACIALSGLARGNCICSEEASVRGYGNPLKWRLWLSDSNTDGKDNISYSPALTYVQASSPSTIIANPGQLLSGMLANAIDTSGGAVRTATDINGIKKGTGTFCSNWTSATVGGSVAEGLSDATNNDWTDASIPLISCATNLPLYCFETP